MRYVALMMLSVFLVACGGSSNSDSNGSLDVTNASVTIQVADGIFTPPQSAMDGAYQYVVECTGIHAPPPTVYFVDHNVTQETIVGVGMAFDPNTGVIVIDGRKPDGDSDADFTRRLQTVLSHMAVHYVIWWSPVLSYKKIGHNHDFYATCTLRFALL